MPVKIRDQKQDIVKGLGILTVIDFHCVITTNLSLTLKFGWTSSLMLIFFFLAGLNYTPGKRSLGEDIKIRCTGLLRPFFQYLVFELLLCGSWILTHGMITPAELLSSVLKFIGLGFHPEYLTYIIEPLVPAWFAVDLFLASLLFFALARFTGSSERKTWSCIVLLTLISATFSALNVDIPVWHIQTLPGLAAVMFLGMECKKYHVLEKIPAKPLPGLGILLLSMALADVLFHFFSGANQLSQGIWGTLGFWSVPLAYAVLALNFLTYYSMAAILEKIPVLCRAGSWLGRHSLTLLLVHFPILWTLGKIIGWGGGSANQTFSRTTYLRDVALFLMTLALSSLWCVFADWYKRKRSHRGSSREL